MNEVLSHIDKKFDLLVNKLDEVKDEVRSELKREIKAESKKVKTHLTRVMTQKTNLIVETFEGELNKDRRRLDRIETHLGLPPLQ